MKKSHKKIENILRIQLTDVCEQAKDEVPGFEWLTHFVDYESFPSSLYILCIFNHEEEIASMLNAGQNKRLSKLIKEHLAVENITLKDLDKQIGFDSEELCELEHAGKWEVRFQQRHEGRCKLH